MAAQTDRGLTVNSAAIKNFFGAIRSEKKIARDKRWLGDRSRGKNDERLVRQSASMRSVQQLAYPHRRHGAAEQIALRLAYCAVGTDQFHLLIGLDAFDHHRHAKVGTEPCNAAQQRQRPIGVDALEEGAVDLHFLQREIVQIAEARVAGAEIVQRDSDADRVQLRQHVMRQLSVAQQRGLGDFDLEAMRWQSGNLQRVTDLAQHVALMELLRREIHRDADAFRPFHAFHAGFAQNPAAEIHDQAHVFRNRDDIDRRNGAANRMIPAQQRFTRPYPSRLEIDERLIEQLEFLVGQRLAQVQLQNTAGFDDLGHFVAEEAESAAAVRLGAIQRHVGVLQERIGADIRRGHGDTDARADFDQVIADLIALAQVLDDPTRQAGRLFGRFNVLLEHDELITAETSYEIFRTQHGAQPVGDRAQELVAAGMTEGVVDLLELVEIDEQQCRQSLGAVGNRQKPLDLVPEVQSIGQRRQLVITR